MVYGYARCSTNEQRQDIERQIRELQAMGAEKIFQEYASSTIQERQQLKLLQEQIQPGDTLIATELSRITRSVHQLCHILEWAAEKNITLVIGQNRLVFDSKHFDPMLEALIIMMGLFGQIERNMTIQRVKSGVANARAKGKRLGRPPMTKDKLPPALKEHYPKYQKGQISKTEYAKLCSLTRPTLYRYLAIYNG